MRHAALATSIALLFASPFAEAQTTLEIGRLQSPTAGFDQGATEIVAYDAGTRRILEVNAQESTVDVLNATDPAFPVKVDQIDVRQLAGRRARGIERHVRFAQRRQGTGTEGVVVGRVGNRTYAFIGLERIGGVMLYDVTNPAQAFHVDYVNGKDVRNLDEPVCTSVNANGTCANAVPNPRAGDLGPEGLAFVPAVDSPNGGPLLIVGNEISGSTRIFEVVAKP